MQLNTTHIDMLFKHAPNILHMLSVKIEPLADADYVAVGHVLDMLASVVDVLADVVDIVATSILGRGIPAGQKWLPAVSAISS